MSEAVLAVDLGGTQMRAAHVTADGAVSTRKAKPTPVDDAAPDALIELAAGVLQSAPARRAVFAVPGVVDYRRGCLVQAPNLPSSWAQALTCERLEQELGIPVSLANDADAAAVGEATFGAGRGYSDVAYMTISTGVGAGVLLGERLVAGRFSAVEIGHTVIDVIAEAEGRPATLEELGSGTALAHQAGAAGLPADGAQIVELVRAGDRRARRVWDSVVSAAAAGVRNLILTYSPEVLVIGGGVGRSGEVLLAPIRDAVRSLSPPHDCVRIVGAALGDDAGLVGAAGWQQATTAWAQR